MSFFNTLMGISGLALADSINVCAFAVLTMVLVTILIQNPKKRNKVLFSGLAFIGAVFIMYFVYGVILYQLFHTLTKSVQEISLYFLDGLSILMMIIGALNVKDYFFYTPGSVGTEMPLFMRPKVKKIIQKITNPSGSFLIGLFVTLFLLPCTIAPLFGAMGLLLDSGYTLIGSIPWLLYYNLLFVLPMIIVTLIIFFGLKEVNEISGWKERNIKKLHLGAGILLFFVGLALLLGWL